MDHVKHTKHQEVRKFKNYDIKINKITKIMILLSFYINNRTITCSSKFYIESEKNSIDSV